MGPNSSLPQDRSPSLSEDLPEPDHDLLEHAHKIHSPLSLPYGRVVSNRLVKVAMYEHFAPLWGSSPHSEILALYSKWAAGNWGIIITGNVQVAKDHLPLGRDMVIPDELSEVALAPWRRLADTIHFGSPGVAPFPSPGSDSGSCPLAIMQLSHGGRQSLNFYGGRPLFAPPLAPSPIRVGQIHAGKDGWLSDIAHRLMLQVPREMTHLDIQHAVSQFVHGAQLAAQSGWDGIELHAAHGYLINQFMSRKSNHRTDEYSAETDPLRFLRDIVTAIRAPGVVPEDFVVGVKINSADYVRETERQQDSEERALGHVLEIGKWGLVDFIEVSGGDYEDPQFIDTVEAFKSPRQVVFESFAENSMKILESCIPTATNRSPPVVLLTGGLNTLPRMVSVLQHDHAHLLGIGRLSVLHPQLPATLSSAIAARSTHVFSSSPPVITELGRPLRSYLSLRAIERLFCYVLVLIWTIVPARIPRVIGASAGVNWYNIMLRRISQGGGVDYTIGSIGATLRWYLCSPPYGSDDKQGGIYWTVIAGIVLGIGIGITFV